MCLRSPTIYLFRLIQLFTKYTWDRFWIYCMSDQDKAVTADEWMNEWIMRTVGNTGSFSLIPQRAGPSLSWSDVERPRNLKDFFSLTKSYNKQKEYLLWKVCFDTVNTYTSLAKEIFILQFSVELIYGVTYFKDVKTGFYKSAERDSLILTITSSLFLIFY